MAVYLKPGLVEQIKSTHHIGSNAEVAAIIGCSASELERLIDHRQCMSVIQLAAIVARFGVPYSRITTEEKRNDHTVFDHS